MKAVRLERDSFRLAGGLIRKFLPLGVCSLLSQLSLVAAMAAINNMIRKYGAMDPVLSEAAVGAVATVIAECLPLQLISIFGAANESVYYTEFAVRAFRVYLCMMTLACVNKGTFIFLQSLGKAAASTFLSMVREVVFGVGFALLLPVFFGLDGVLYSMPVSDVLTFLIGAVLIAMTYRQLGEKSGEAAAGEGGLSV